MRILQINVLDKNRQFKATISPRLLWHRSRRAWQCESLSHRKTPFPFPIWPPITSGGKTGKLKVLDRSWGLWETYPGRLSVGSQLWVREMKGGCSAALTDQNKCVGLAWEEFLKQKELPRSLGTVGSAGPGTATEQVKASQQRSLD